MTRICIACFSLLFSCFAVCSQAQPPDIGRWTGNTALNQTQGFAQGDPLRLTWGFAALALRSMTHHNLIFRLLQIISRRDSTASTVAKLCGSRFFNRLSIVGALSAGCRFSLNRRTMEQVTLRMSEMTFLFRSAYKAFELTFVLVESDTRQRNVATTTFRMLAIWSSTPTTQSTIT